MTVNTPDSASEVGGIGVGNVQALLRHFSSQIPRTQFLRELPFNSIQACQRAGGGEVHIDFLDVPGTTGPVRKLRIRDTGDGMTPEMMADRMNNLSAEAATDDNFGSGAKMALYKVSPAGALYVSMRDGHAHFGRLQTGPDGTYGLKVLNADATEHTARHTVEVPTSELPDGIRDAGHGTCVVLLGQDVDDPTWWSLRPTGSESRAWALEYLNDRFTQIPDGVKVTALREEGRGGDVKFFQQQVRGSADNLRHYTKDHKESLEAASGARGKIRLTSPVPATAYWWVLPEPRPGYSKPPSYMRIGGRVRVVHHGEAYTTEKSSYLNEAGIWACTSRVEIHFVPDDGYDVRPDYGRTMLQIEGAPAPLVDWCREFKQHMPAAIKRLLEGASAKSSSRGGYGQKLLDMGKDFAAVAIRNNRGNRYGTPTGQIVQYPAGYGTRPNAHPNPGGKPVKGVSLRKKVARLLRPAGSPAGTDGMRRVYGAGDSTANGEAVNLAVPGRARASRSGPALPQVVWVNRNHTVDDPELLEHAARFVESDNRLIINAEFPTYQRLLGMWEAKYRHVPGARTKIAELVDDYWEAQLVDPVLGAMRDLPADLRAEILSPTGLSTAACGVYQTQQRLKAVFGRMFPREDGTPAGGCDIDEVEANGSEAAAPPALVAAPAAVTTAA